jgi:hypothetical protein
MIERILRRVFKAPTMSCTFEEDASYPRYAVGLPELGQAIIGVEQGEEAFIASELVTVFTADIPVASTHLIGLLGHGPHPIRRRVLSRITRHLVGAAWTLAGMAIVLLTLSGTVQVLSLLICVMFFAVDLMSIYLREP